MRAARSITCGTIANVCKERVSGLGGKQEHTTGFPGSNYQVHPAHFDSFAGLEVIRQRKMWPCCKSDRISLSH
jgi:hypothetical protein